MYVLHIFGLRIANQELFFAALQMTMCAPCGTTQVSLAQEK